MFFSLRFELYGLCTSIRYAPREKNKSSLAWTPLTRSAAIDHKSQEVEDEANFYSPCSKIRNRALRFGHEIYDSRYDSIEEQGMSRMDESGHEILTYLTLNQLIWTKTF